MIDGVKIVFYSLTIIKDLLRLGVKVVSPLEEATGEIHFPIIAEHKNLRFKISKSNRVEIRGSLHLYWRGENFSDFTFGELCECIADLCLKFNINPLEANLEGVEFGVNVSTLFNPFEFCENVIAFKNESFSKFRTSGNKRHLGFYAQQQQYSVKVYDKGREYFKEHNILRFEVKISRMIFLQSKGIKIFHLSDLTKPEVSIRLGELLNKMFSECIVSDKVRTSELTATELKIYTVCSNPKVWEKFNFRERYRKRKQFERIIETYGVNKWKGVTARMIRDKWNFLSSFKPESVENLTDLPKEQKGEFNCLDKGLIYHTSDLPEKRFCKSCGRDISNQKKGSVFCSESIFGKEAKRCRNKNSNPRNNFLNREQRIYGGLNLFDVEQLLSKVE